VATLASEFRSQSKMEIEADRAIHLRFKPQAPSQNPLKRVELPNTSTGKSAPECLKESAGIAIPSQVTLKIGARPRPFTPLRGTESLPQSKTDTWHQNRQV
jgi:hypothetical protein